MSDDTKPAETPESRAAVEIRGYPFTVEDVRAAQNGRTDDFTIKGHASVFDTWTDLGPFRERIAKGAFNNVLSRDPHVLHLIDHDTRYVLSSTRNKTLELRVDPKGLHMWSKVAPTSYAADLRVLMERGDVSQSSFAFTVKDEKWQERTENGAPVIERTITEIGELYDVTTTAMGAYPTTDSQVAARTLQAAKAAGLLPDPTPAEPQDTAPEHRVAVENDETPLTEGEADSEAGTAAPIAVAGVDADLRLLKRQARKALTHERGLRDALMKAMGNEVHKEDRGR